MHNLCGFVRFFAQIVYQIFVVISPDYVKKSNHDDGMIFAEVLHDFLDIFYNRTS